ncbi:MAG: LysR family transcriptional regulator [Rhodobacteraceae bacterium]|nr:LysR family transcriptional regulator [Paracoccaceae bacterium]
MIRNLDLTALRSFITVAELGGVTKAAAQLHLTQSAVSMQLKRLEEALGQALLVRSGRGVRLSLQGEQLLGYGRRILALNDEVWLRMTDAQFEGEVSFGVPADIVYPHVPGILKRFAQDYPRVKVQLVSSYTEYLKGLLAAGKIDMILTTEHGMEKGGEELRTAPLIWVGGEDGRAWEERPLRLAFEGNCIFRPTAQRALSDAGIEWDMVVTSNSTRTIEATVSADLAIHALLAETSSPYMHAISHNGALPELPMFNINMYVAKGARREMAERLAEYVRLAYGADG